MNATLSSSMSDKMPVLFVGHGSPMNALEDNEFTRAWKRVAADIPRPKAILCISAHWLKEGTAVTAMERPRTIHDFYGFPDPLNKIRYPAKGSPKLAKSVQEFVQTVAVDVDHEWGLDHGAWSVLRHMYPEADIPIVQLSLDYQLPLEKAFRVGKEVSPLRKKGVLIIASGNLVHNLMAMNPSIKPYRWAIDFDGFVKDSLAKGAHHELIEYAKRPSARLAHPTNDHYLPLLYSLGAAANEKPEFFNEKITMASLSMRSVIFGMHMKR